MSMSMGVADPSTGFGGPTPTAALASPIGQQQLQYYQKMSPEQLQEMLVRAKGSPQAQLIQRVLQQKQVLNANPGQPAQQGQAQSQQSLAPAQPASGMGPLPLSTASSPTQQTYAGGGMVDPAAGPPKAYAIGGMLESQGGVHFPERGIQFPSARPPAIGMGGSAGFLHTAGPGRTDNLSIRPHADSYVLPADVVSGLGQGNSLAGAKAMDLALHTGPHGVGMPSPKGNGFGLPRPPHGPSQGFGAGHMGASLPGGLRPPSASGGAGIGAGGFARGGMPQSSAPETVPVVAAGGEYIIPPDKVREIGGGDVAKGHKILDAFVLHIRKRTIAEMAKLKGPVKS